jgi:hypothetical protein
MVGSTCTTNTLKRQKQRRPRYVNAGADLAEDDVHSVDVHGVSCLVRNVEAAQDFVGHGTCLSVNVGTDKPFGHIVCHKCQILKFVFHHCNGEKLICNEFVLDNDLLLNCNL